MASVYGLASKPLSTAVEAVTDLLAAYGQPLPIRQDTAMEPDFLFLRRFTLLSLHTMLAQHHWECLVATGVRLCEEVMVVGGRGREWVREMLPLILEGQARLARRVAEHSSDLKRKGEQTNPKYLSLNKIQVLAVDSPISDHKEFTINVHYNT